MARKLYAYVRKSQEGTPMAKLIRGNPGKAIQAANNAGPRETRLASDATGLKGPGVAGAKRSWKANTKKAAPPRKIREYMDKHGGSKAAATKALKRATDISFAADPKRK